MGPYRVTQKQGHSSYLLSHLDGVPLKRQYNHERLFPYQDRDLLPHLAPEVMEGAFQEYLAKAHQDLELQGPPTEEYAFEDLLHVSSASNLSHAHPVIRHALTGLFDIMIEDMMRKHAENTKPRRIDFLRDNLSQTDPPPSQCATSVSDTPTQTPILVPMQSNPTPSTT